MFFTTHHPMRFLYIPAFLILAVLLVNCAGAKRNSKKTSPEYSITFGRTGGFTNINPVFTVTSKGEVSRKSNQNASAIPLKKLTQTQIDSVSTFLYNSKFHSLKIDFPYNITNYIELQDSSGISKIQWSKDEQITPEIKKLHSYLLSLIKN